MKNASSLYVHTCLTISDNKVHDPCKSCFSWLSVFSRPAYPSLWLIHRTYLLLLSLAWVCWIPLSFGTSLLRFSDHSCCPMPLAHPGFMISQTKSRSHSSWCLKCMKFHRKIRCAATSLQLLWRRDGLACHLSAQTLAIIVCPLCSGPAWPTLRSLESSSDLGLRGAAAVCAFGSESDAT